MHENLNRLQSSDLQTLHRDGICLKPGFFSPKAVSELRETTLRMRPLSMDHRNPARRWLLLGPSYALRKSFNRPLKNDLVYLSGVATSCGFREFSAQYFDESAHLNHIMSIESPRSPKAITVWHTDANSKADNLLPSDQFILKFFIYLNDVSPSNGAFAYARGTHRIVTMLRQGMFEKKIPYYKTGLLAELIQAASTPDIAAYLLQRISPQELDTFLHTLNSLSDEKPGDNTHDLSGPAGTLLIFDDRGVHRGGVPEHGDRSILRYNYQHSKYWKKSYTPFKYSLNMACKTLLPRSIGANW
jgi:hypothetical protein